MGDNSFLKISGIKKSFGSGDNRTEVLRGIDFEVAKGEFCVLLGPSGSGKSTLLNIIGGIDSPDSGYISIDGEKTGDMDEKTLTMTVAAQEMTKTYSYSDIEQMVEIERMYLLETNEKTWQFIAKSAFSS